MTQPLQVANANTQKVILIGTDGVPYNASAGGGTSDVNLAQVAGASTATGHGTAAGALRVELPTDGTGVVGLNAGTAIVGKVGIDQTTPGSTNAVAIGQIGATTVATGNGVVGTGVQRVTIASDSTGTIIATGGTASGASLTANPVTTGGLAETTVPTAVADGQVVNSQHDIYGRQIVVGAVRTNKGVQVTTITSSTAETTIVTADATYKNDLYGLILANSSASATKVTLKDSTSGTTRAILYVPAGDTRGFMLPVDSGFQQNAANNNWTATCGTSVADLLVTALYVKNL